MNLLVTDLHLDDNPDNEYRWAIWDHIHQAVIQHHIETVFILGDWVDRKDRFTARFINRLFDEVYRLCGQAGLVVLRGNHDTAMTPPSYFDFMASGPIAGFEYITSPRPFSHQDMSAPPVLLLPFTAAPKTDWAGLNLADYMAAFMHATVTGAVVENGMVMENANFPILPRHVKFYSGDVHVPQKVRNITYVGAPHPIKFGDDFPCRMLVLDEAYDIVAEIPLSPPRKIMADIRDLADLDRLKIRQGDQIKIRFNCPPSQIEHWGTTEQQIRQWASEHGVTVAGTEIIVGTRTPDSLDVEQTPEAILRGFCGREGLSEGLLQTGLDLLAALR
jgi:hypothetical protein